MKHAWVLVASLLCGSGQAGAPADLVFVGDHIITMEGPDRRVGALAVRGESIVWTGDAADATDWIGPGTRVHQLGARALLPGFIDAHGHLTYQAAIVDLANVASPPVGPVTDIRALQQTLARHIDERRIAAGDWVIGNGYDDSLLAEGHHPTRADLDVVSSRHPIALVHVSGHLATANSLALAAMGYDAESEDPPGGQIRRQPGSRVPNGVLEETAMGPVRAQLSAPRGNPVDGVEAALALYASFGITTVQDGATSAAGRQLLEAMDEDGRLSLDVVIYPYVAGDDAPLPLVETVGRYRNRLKVGGIKLVLDGSPQGKTAYLSAPYHVPPDGQPVQYRGYPLLQQPELNRVIAKALGQRIAILAHANGDAAADMLLEALAAAGVHAAGSTNHRTVMIHAQTVRPDQLRRMRELGVIPSFFSAHTFYWGDWHRDSVLGPERASRISPTGSAHALGLPFTVHNDAPIVPPDMLRLLWATANRVTRSGAVLGPEERLDVYAALQAMTSNAAFQYFEEDRKGTLQAGKQADLVLLSRSPLEVAPAKLTALAIEGTWSRGTRVFDAGAAGDSGR